VAGVPLELDITTPTIQSFYDAVDYLPEGHTIRPEETEISLCPVECWKAYVARVSEFREQKHYTIVRDDANYDKMQRCGLVFDAEYTVPEQRQTKFSQRNKGVIALDNRLFFYLSKDQEIGQDADAAEGNYGPMHEDDLCTLFRAVLDEAQVPLRKQKLVISEPAQVIEYTTSMYFSRLGNIFAARYNKPECLQYFVDWTESEPSRVIFVDDNTDNVMNMFLYWTDKYLAAQAVLTEEKSTPKEVAEAQKVPVINSFWYKPWRRMERFNPMMKDILERLDMMK
jgi:hypothetical protein